MQTSSTIITRLSRELKQKGFFVEVFFVDLIDGVGCNVICVGLIRNLYILISNDILTVIHTNPMSLGMGIRKAYIAKEAILRISINHPESFDKLYELLDKYKHKHLIECLEKL